MKKIIIFIASVLIIILTIFYLKYSEYRNMKIAIKEYNLQYEEYLNKEIDGRTLTSLINKAVDNNEKNSVQKNEEGFYIENDINSMKIEIKMIDLDLTYNMETIYNGKMENFIIMYNSILFKSEEVRYNSIGKIKYIRFVQITN